MYSFGFHWVFKDLFNERDSNTDDVGKIGYSRPPQKYFILKKNCHVIVSVLDIIREVLLQDANHILDVVM